MTDTAILSRRASRTARTTASVESASTMRRTRVSLRAEWMSLTRGMRCSSDAGPEILRLVSLEIQVLYLLCRRESECLTARDPLLFQCVLYDEVGIRREFVPGRALFCHRTGGGELTAAGLPLRYRRPGSRDVTWVFNVRQQL